MCALYNGQTVFCKTISFSFISVMQALVQHHATICTNEYNTVIHETLLT